MADDNQQFPQTPEYMPLDKETEHDLIRGLGLPIPLNEQSEVPQTPVHALNKHLEQFADGGKVQTVSAQLPDEVKVYNLQTGQLGTLPHNEVHNAIASGLFSFPKDQQVPVFNSQGQLGTLNPEEAPQAFNNGFKYATPAAQQEYHLDQKYGQGVGNMAKAFGAAALRSATFGASDVGLVNSGAVTAQDLSQLRQRNPGSNLAGEITGVVAPLAAGDELGLLNPVKTVSNIGHAVSGGAQAALPEATSVAGQVLNNALAKGAGSAVEGLAYGTGNAVTEKALGDPAYNAESVGAHIGLSGLLGGALGSVLGAGEIALPQSILAAKAASNSLKSTVFGEPGEGKLADKIGSLYDKTASFVSGKNEADIAAARLNRANLGNTPEEIEQFSTDMSKALQNHYEAMNKASKDAFKDVRPEEAEHFLIDSDPKLAADKFSQINDYLTNTINDLKAEPELYPARYARKLEQLRDRFLGKPSEVPEVYQEGLGSVKMPMDELHPGSPSDVYKALNDLKQNLDTNIGYGKIPSAQDQDAQNVIKKLRGVIKESLEDPNVFGEAGSRQAAFNSAFSDFKNAKEQFQKKFMTKFTTKSGGIGYKVDPVKVNSYLNQVSDIRGTAKSEILHNFNTTSNNYLDEIEKSYGSLPDKEFDKDAIQDLSKRSFDLQNEFNQKAALQSAVRRLDSGSNGLGGAGAVISHALGVPAPLIAAYSIVKDPLLTIQRLAKFEKLINKTNAKIVKGASNLFKFGTSVAEDTSGFLGSRAEVSLRKDDHDKKVDSINRDASNPEQFIDKLQKSTSSLQNHAPDNSAALQNFAVNALSFLKSKLPQTGPDTPLGPKLPPSKSDISKFNKYYETVENPTSVFKQMKAGMLSSETMEALTSVYPETLAKMRTQVVDEISGIKNKQDIPYKLKVQLGLFMGQDMDLSTNPIAINANQAAQSSAQQQKAEQEQSFIKPTAKGLSSITASQRMLTPAQATAQRSK